MSTGRSVEAVDRTAEIYKKYIGNVKSYESKSTPRQPQPLFDSLNSDDYQERLKEKELKRMLIQNHRAGQEEKISKTRRSKES